MSAVYTTARACEVPLGTRVEISDGRTGKLRRDERWGHQHLFLWCQREDGTWYRRWLDDSELVTVAA